LLGANQVDTEVLSHWLPEWRPAFLAAAETAGVDQRIHAARLNYYEKAMQALLEGEVPLAALWPLIHTWTLSAHVLAEGAEAGSWREACVQLGLLGAGFEERVQALDHYLDEIEAGLDEIAAANGLETSTGR
jgi:hypothetical protein